MRARSGLFVVLACLLVWPGFARAHDHRPPRATLFVGDAAQEGRNHHADWVRAAKNEPGICVATFGSGFPRFRKPLTHRPGQPVTIRLRKSAPPLEIDVHRWVRVNEDGSPDGEPHPLGWTVRPHLSNGAIRAWDVVVAWPVTTDHLYIGLDAYWGDEEGCGGTPDLGSQYAAWTFHLKAP